MASLLIGERLESSSGVGPFSVMTFDRVGARSREAIVHQAIASPHAPEGRGSHFVGGILGTVLDDSIASPDVVQQEIAEGVKHFAPQSGWNGKGAAIQHRSRRDGRDGSDVASGTTELAEDLLPGLGVGSCEQSGIYRRRFGSSHEGGKLVYVVIYVFWIRGGLADGGGIRRVETTGDALFVHVGVPGK